MVSLRNNTVLAPSHEERHLSLMVYLESEQHTIIASQDETLPLYLVDQSDGTIISRNYVCPVGYALVSSDDFKHLYYLVQDGQCTCAERSGCLHAQDGQIVNLIQGDKLVQVTWDNLPDPEKQEAYNVLFAPCSYEAQWEVA
jgi:hypothetical protein